MRRRWLLVIGLLLCTGCARGHVNHHARVEPLPHFFHVDHQLYRGGQPTDEGFRRLARMGVKTIVSLRSEDALQRRAEQQLVESLGMRWMHLPMWAMWRPTDRQVLAFLDVALGDEQGPVFVHCRKGEDRTGMLVAVYRVVAHGWAPRAAYDEALELGMTKHNPLAKYMILEESRQEYARQNVVASLID